MEIILSVLMIFILNFVLLHFQMLWIFQIIMKIKCNFFRFYKCEFVVIINVVVNVYDIQAIAYY